MKKINVLQVITSTVGGAGIHVYYLTRHLDNNRFHNVVAFTPGQHLDYRFYDLEVEVIPLTMGRNINVKGMWTDIIKLFHFMKSNEIDIVHTHNTLAGIVGRLAAKMAGVPITIHMIHTFAAHPNVPPLKGLFYSMLERLWDVFTTHYIAGSEFVRTKAIRNGKVCPNKITTIYYAVDIEAFLDIDISPKCLDERRKALGLSSEDRIIGFIGRLEEQKGPQIFIRAIAEVIQVVSNVIVLMIGDGVLRDQLLEQCQVLGIYDRVLFLGWRTDIPELLSIIDIFSLASVWESFGIVFAEASIMQKPIVATNVEGIPEVVVDGKSGLLVDCNNPAQLARALIHLLDSPDLARSMGEFGRNYILDNFSIQSMIEAHEKLYLELFQDLNNPSSE